MQSNEKKHVPEIWFESEFLVVFLVFPRLVGILSTASIVVARRFLMFIF